MLVVLEKQLKEEQRHIVLIQIKKYIQLMIRINVKVVEFWLKELTYLKFRIQLPILQK